MGIKLNLEPEGRASFQCPGCGQSHTLRTSGPDAWQFNGSVVSPTLQPSILFTSGHYAQGWQGPKCWCTYKAEHPEETDAFSCLRCHSYITDGNIRFLDDCTHTLKGRTVEIPDWK